jgi:ADP-ribosyl-[dinitrogen reductase] hydrolase
MKRTSLTHPLQIAVVSAGPKFGRVGITFCPGKYDRHARTGEWVRDLALDLDAVRDWGAAAVVTLLEPKELALLRVQTLGEEIQRRKMLWFHLPIVNVSIPDEKFEREWVAAGEELRSMLRRRLDVLIHCRGGLGRAGTIAAPARVDFALARPGGALRRKPHCHRHGNYRTTPPGWRSSAPERPPAARLIGR